MQRLCRPIAFALFALAPTTALAQSSVATVRRGADEPERAIELPSGTTGFTVDTDLCADTFQPPTESGISGAGGHGTDVFFMWRPTRDGEVVFIGRRIHFEIGRSQGALHPGGNTIVDWRESDDFRGIQRTVQAGETYVVRLFPWESLHWAGPSSFRVWELGSTAPPPFESKCVDLGRADGGLPAMSTAFLNVSSDGPVVLHEIEFESRLDPLMLNDFADDTYFEVYLCVGGASGREADPDAWTLASRGVADSSGGVLLEDIVLGPGMTGVAIHAINFVMPLDSEAVVADESIGDRSVTLFAGSASDDPFTGPVLAPASFAGRLCFVHAPDIGSSYCGPAQPNSTGTPAWLHAMGSHDAESSGFDLIATGLPVDSTGYVLVSPTANYVPMAGGSSGTLCVGVPLGRYAGTILRADARGLARMGVDPSAIPQPHGLVAAGAGETWRFQLWYRDVTSQQVPTSNHTDGIQVTFY